ncbi:Insulinase (Peptidase M16) family protein [Clavispora lusitaniae]|uniref:Insulinase (Peptidase M16) family protein n=1 Tax=Clavispora lusitaniae TaxID=36911 RepID=UPI00202C36B8|nr:Insulinase (Peptidase M16) family protein [Clavispora lusitaniae]
MTFSSIEPELELPLAYKHRQHLFVTLDNGLRCFLINDTSTDLVSGSLLAGTGNFSDPQEVPGVAHLAEHIMMRASKKSDKLENLIVSSGGDFNAYTSAEKTCFYFEISTYAENTIDSEKFVLDYLLAALANRIQKPQINDKYIKQEIVSVDDEHNGNGTNVEKLFLHSLKLLANPDHPFSRFGCGNSTTLKSVPTPKIKSLVSAHINQHFKPQNMVLVLKGPQTLIHLRKMVVSNFSASEWGRNNSLPSSPKTIRSSFSFFEDYTAARLFGDHNCLLIKTDVTKKIRLFFPLKRIRYLVDYQPVSRLLCSLIGDESLDTVCDYLKRRLQWANQVYVFLQEICKDEEILIIEVVPTIQGQKKEVEIKEMILFYIESTIANASKDQIMELVYHYDHIERYLFYSRKPTISSTEEVCSYAESLISGELDKELIKGFKEWTYIEHAYDDLQLALKECLTTNNLKMVVLGDDMRYLKMGSTNVVIGKDPFFHFEYILSTVSFEQSTRFNFKLSTPKKMIEKWAPLPCKEIALGKMSKIRDFKSSSRSPILQFFDDSMELWLEESEEESENTNIIVASICIKFPQVSATTRNSVILDLLTEIVGRELKPTLYHLEMIGSEWGIYSNVNGSISIMVNCTATKQALLILTREILANIKRVFKAGKNYNYHQLKGPRKVLREKYDEYVKTSGVRKVFGASYMILEENLHSPEERVEALELLDTSDIEEFLSIVDRSASYSSILISGSMDKDECITFSQLVKSSSKPNSSFTSLENSSIILGNGTHVFEMSDESLSAVMYYLQVGERVNTYAFTMAKVIEHILNVTATEELRMKRELAYGYFTGIRIFRRTFGIYMLVPSGKYSCNHIVHELEDYLKYIEFTIDEMTERDFQNQIMKPFMESLDKDNSDNTFPSGLFAVLEPQHGSGPKPTSDFFKEHWGHLDQILNGTYNFQSRHCEEEISLAVLQSITRQEVYQFIRTYISTASSQRAALVICTDASKSEKRRKMVAETLASQLQKSGCTTTTEDMMCVLSECEDQHTFSDMIKPLQKHFTERRQGASFMKFRLKYVMGSTIRRNRDGIKSRSKKRSEPDRRTYNDFREIQRQGSIAQTGAFHQRRERLERILLQQSSGF